MFLLEIEIQLRQCQSRRETVHACLALQVLHVDSGMRVDVCASAYMP